MTIDITPKTILRMATGFEFDGDKTTATTLRALSSALTASQAETAAAYEAAIGAVRQADEDCKGAYGACENIRALTPTDSKAAIDRMIADAEERGMRKALDAASDYTQRVYGEEWTFLSNPIDRERIIAAIQKGTPHE